MKKLIRITLFLAVAAISFVSCEKDDPEPDPADKFVGSYSGNAVVEVTKEYLGLIPSTDIKTATVSAIFTKVDANTVKDDDNVMYSVVDDQIIFKGEVEMGYDGNIFKFKEMSIYGKMTGNSLTLTYQGTGTSNEVTVTSVKYKLTLNMTKK
jgi:hypothetical protein